MGELKIKIKSEETIKYLPCIRCGSDDIEFNDCGYNTFNPGWGKCKNCGKKAEVSDVNSGDIRPLVRNWNEANDFKRLFTKQQHNVQSAIERLIMFTGVSDINSIMSGIIESAIKEHHVDNHDEPKRYQKFHDNSDK